MKKTTFILAVFYFLSVVGYGMEVHYCLGQIKDVNYAFFETSCCCDEAGMAVSENCCNEQTFFVQLSDEHQNPSKVSVEKSAVLVITKTDKPPVEFIFSKLELALPSSSNSPPPILYERNCALIFYA